MNERESLLAITERKPQRVGGCISIIFQLFDWNRSLSSKKLFSKNLLPPVRSEQSSKKFGGDDKKPKLRLIANENSGGFPNVKKFDHENKHETRAPSLVAKLMGLDYMPAVQKSNSRKGFLANGSNRTENIVSECQKLERKELILEPVDVRNEWRPQKLRKTGLSERRPVAKLGADTLHIKTVLSRSRKHQLPKRASSVKSPTSSRKNSSRLIDVATRILEPGFQKSRGRQALSYSNSSSCHYNYETVTDERMPSPPKLQNSSRSYTIPTASPPKGQSPCTNPGVKPNMLGFGSTPLEPAFRPVSPVSHFRHFCSQEYDPRNVISYLGLEDIKAKSPCGSASQSNTFELSYDLTPSRKPLGKEGQTKWQLASQQQCNSDKDVKQKNKRQNQTLQMKDRKLVKSKLSSVQGNRVSTAVTTTRETKLFAPLGQRLSGHAGHSVPGKMDDWKYESERKTRIHRKGSMSSDLKKRPTTFYQKYGSLGSSIDLRRQSRAAPEVISEREDRCKVVSLSRHTKSSSTKSEDQRRTGSGVKKGNAMHSFTFGSSDKCMTRGHSDIENCGVHNNPSFENICADAQSTGLPNPLSMSGEALSTLLEQKLKELNSLDEDDFAKVGNAPKKTTAVILQELICALTTNEQHFHDHSVSQSDDELHPCYNHHCLSNTDTSFRFKAQHTSPPTSSTNENGDNHQRGYIQAQHTSPPTSSTNENGDNHHHLSPGSVLEASISIDSCSSSNQDDIPFPRNKLVYEPTSSFNGEQNTWEPDANLVESIISQRLNNSGQVQNKLFNNVTEVLCSISVTETSLEGSKLHHAKGVILHAELVLANEGFPISHFLFTELETLASLILVSFSYTQCWNQVKGFTFDSIIEYLESRYIQYSNCGFVIWSRLPWHMDNETVINDIIQEIRRWTELAGMIPDDLIEWDMSHSLGKWTDFEVEAFESGVELDQHILQTLIDELVTDLCKCY